jgi:hypothetical protein
MADRDSMDMWDDLTELHDTLETLAVDSEERKAHLWRIFREGLSVEAESCFFYSFCEKNWEYVNDYTHCATCNKCYSVRSSWHCGVCRKCCHNGAYEPCQRWNLNICWNPTSRVSARHTKQQQTSNYWLGI